MTTPTETLVHGAGPGPAATHCGLAFADILRLSPNRSRVTCPACLTAMGEPRVISGLGTAAATPERTCPKCEWAAEPAAAPAPGAGEGPRELTPGEARKAAPADVEVQLDSGDWCPFGAASNWQASFLDRAKFRLKPEPLPAPAPRVSRVEQMVDEWKQGGMGDLSHLCKRAVHAVMLEVNCRIEHGASPTQVAAVEELFVGDPRQVADTRCVQTNQRQAGEPT